MIEKTIEVTTSDGIMPACIFHPEGEGPHPAVIFYFDIFGIRDELKNMCRRFARAGYYTVLPSLFYRMGNPSYNPEKFMSGNLNLEKTDPLHPMNLNTSTTNAMVIDDTGALLRHLDNEEPQADAQRVGTIGTCMGGRHALFAAATYPDQCFGLCLHSRRQTRHRCIGLAPSRHTQTQSRRLLWLGRPGCRRNRRTLTTLQNRTHPL